ncbi:MAG: hypothetical protein ACKVQW_10135 [Pyrinomonadaceae bacterium]
MATNVLIVLDGGYRFATGATPAGTPDFTYETLVGALEGAGMAVTKAHRQLDSTATAGWTSFRFDAPPPGRTLLEFDAIWLIGLQGRNVQLPNSTASGANALDELQLQAISRYMDVGGGVFATGDHDSIGADMCGLIPRVRAMRAWFGEGDSFPQIPAGLPRNNPRSTGARADTTRRNPAGQYNAASNPDGATNHVWFENQSDSVPQTIAPTTTPTHPILRRNGSDITVFPDHMHEGKCLGDVGGYDYGQTLTFNGEGFVEFPVIDMPPERPEIIATGSTEPFASRDAVSGALVEGTALSDPDTVEILSVYDGRATGVGRVVTGSTFHHYVDINLTGDIDIVPGTPQNRAGADAAKGVGFNANVAVFDNIKAVFVNITNWLARPRPVITLNLERSTFGQDEVTGNPHFGAAIRVTVDGLRPSDFPGGPVTTGPFDPAWAPVVTAAGAAFITITPVAVSSDDPAMPERLQRFTFIYDVDFANSAFGDQVVTINATLSTPAAPAALTDSAFFQLVTSANPFMLDLDGGNTTHWLSSDLKVFRVIAGAPLAAGLPPGATLPAGASRADAFTMINDLKDNITVTQFEAIPSGQGASALSSMPTTTMSGANVYNFAIARVRRNGTMLSANNVRVFFRIFTSQTTAALTYNGGIGDGYPKTGGGSPIALPGESGGQWLSFPCFSEDRNADRNLQDDNKNVRSIDATDSEEFFGVLLDTNLAVNYLPSTPGGGGGNQSLRTLLAGEHQCLVAQIEFAGTPIPNSARPSTSDKLAQRNIAISEVANPGMTASRAAFHTFEIEATPRPISDNLPPDELLLDWSPDIPVGSYARLHIPGWNAEEVVGLADRFYPRHEIRSIDAHTIEIPGGGMRYIPIPKTIFRQTGVLTVELPLGIKKGQRFDVSVRQITNRGRNIKFPQPKVEQITFAEAGRLLTDLGEGAATGATVKRGVFDLGENRVLVTDLSVFDVDGDFALVIQHPDPKKVAEAHADARMWRETVGAFTLGIPVSTKRDMLLYQQRLFSLMSWRLAHMPRNSRWYPTMTYYIAQLSEKVQGLGGNPWQIPPTPDGAIPQLPWVDDNGEDVIDGAGSSVTGDLLDPKNPFTRGCIVGLVIALVILIALVIIYALWG